MKLNLLWKNSIKLKKGIRFDDNISYIKDKNETYCKCIYGYPIMYFIPFRLIYIFNLENLCKLED